MIDEEKFNTAGDFLNALRITNERWITPETHWGVPWIFRGQPDANMSLIPSAWRTDKLNRFKDKYKSKFESYQMFRLEQERNQIHERIQRNEITERDGQIELDVYLNNTQYFKDVNLQFFVEMQAVKEFIEFADKLGYPVPSTSDYFVPQIRNYKDLPEEDYLMSHFHIWTEFTAPFNVKSGAVALAQHHGVSTRLLDWTESPPIAAFFAADEIKSQKHECQSSNDAPSHIAVWAISTNVFSSNDPDSGYPTKLQMITRPRHENSFLMAQKAVFTHDKGANDVFMHTGKWRSVEEAVENDSSHLKKLTLPIQEIGELRRLLWFEGISRAHLMPTFDNVTRALEEKARWENQ